MESGRKSDRKAVGLLVKLAHANVETFAEEYATNLSPGGMFIRSKQPQPIGTRVSFEVQIAGGVRVMRGTAVVRWIRQAGDPAGAPGMGVQFDQLDASTKALVEKMLKPADEPPPDLAALLAAEVASPAAPLPAIPSIASIAPAIAPVAPVVPKAPAPVDSGIAIDFGGSSSSDEQEVPIEFEGSTQAPPGSIDLSLDSLIAETPAPSAQAAPMEEVRAPRATLDLFSDVNVDSGASADIEIDFGGDDAPAPAPAAASDTSFEVDFGSEPEPAPPAPAPAPKAAAPVAAKAPSVLPPRAPNPPPKAAPAPPPTLAKPAAPAAAPKLSAGPVFLKPPASIDATGPVIGIDLGTTNSCVGIIVNGKPTVMRSKQGYNTLPSIVSLTAQGKVLVAHPAKQQMVLNPTRTIYGAKRLVGRTFDSPTVKQVQQKFPYEVTADSAGKAAVKLGDHVLSLDEIQGLILRECKEMAERELNRPINRAVVTVPAYYSEPQREAVRKAGALAGLKVERILNEPTAAALAFGMNRELNRKILVYDLGGGTFDATVLKIEKNVFEVLATGGDTFLGGTDFDNTLTDLLLRKFEQTEGIPLPPDAVAFSRVSEMAEKAKCALSELSTFDVHIPMLVMDPNGGKSRELRCTLTREEVEQATMALVDRTLDAVRDVLLDAKVTAKEIDDVILVGGQSRMPLVRNKLKELFGKQAHAGVNADEAVALGAALYSGSVDKVSSVVLIDVLPMTIGVAMAGGSFKRVLERNTPLPAQRSFSLPTTKDNATVMEFQVFQGEDNNVAGNEYLGTVRIEGLPKAPKGVVKVAVTLRLDAECVLHAEALELTSRKAVKATLATRYSSEEVQKKLGITADAVNKANAKKEEELKGRSGGFWGLIRRVVGR